jgi:N-acetylmuramoyl-L-alanine amidase
MVILKRKGVRLEFSHNQSEVLMNGIKFMTSFPLRKQDNDYFLHAYDLTYLLDPVLRPYQLSQHNGFDTVIIDPGHGGHDSGAVSAHDKNPEKELSLQLAKKLTFQLRKRGFKVGLTRNKENYLTLQQRVSYANSHPNAIFISLHFNSDDEEATQGIETFVLSPKLQDSNRSKISGDIALATAIHANCIKRTDRTDRGVRRALHSTLTAIKHPAILLEAVFLSNKEEAETIATSAYQDRLALAIAEAVVKYKYATRGAQAKR